MKNNNTDDDFVVLDNFQDYIVRTKTYKKFEYHTFAKEQAVLYKGRIYHINTFDIDLLSVDVEDMKSGIKGDAKGRVIGLRRILKNDDLEIFETCVKLARKISNQIIKEAADLKINEIKIVEPDNNTQ